MAALIEQIASERNLELAWRRITTGGNYQYKRFYRQLYVAYEIALKANLKDLRARLLGGTFAPRQPERVYLPKRSGLHRPLSLLHLEDQIVLQAFGNVAARRLYRRRAPLQFRVVFSNILEREENIFFFKRWQSTYAAFKKRITRHFDGGLRWVADFDLAAFYDTVSHELLLKTIFPRTAINDDAAWLLDALKTWSSELASSGHAHGIPQGPIASDFLAECFLLPIDEALRSYPGYTRYVDDVRLFGRTENEVRSAVIELERHCREHGLIPQSGKFAIKEAKSVEDAMGMLPSIADPQRSDTDADDAGHFELSLDRARSVFASALDGEPRRVVDKTRLRYVLYRANPDPVLLGQVIRLLPHHPEHADSFFAYISLFDARKPVIRLCVGLIENNPYAYVRGEAWHVLARHLGNSKAIDASTRRQLVLRAVKIARKHRPENFVEQWGACHFLAISEGIGGARHSRFLKHQPALIQAFVADALPQGAFARGEAVEEYLRRTMPEPGLSICGHLNNRGIELAAFGLTAAAIPSQVRNALVELGSIAVRGAAVDAIAETLHARYGLPKVKSWRRLLGSEYKHALGLLKQAEAAFDNSTSFWLACQNSFQHTIFLAMQRHLASVAHPAACTTVNRHGQLVDFGVMLDANSPFSVNCSIVGACFRNMNNRRNHLPVAHPYDKKNHKRSLHLSTKERNKFVHDLRPALVQFQSLMP